MGEYWSVEECAWVQCPQAEAGLDLEIVAELPDQRAAPQEASVPA